MTMPLVFNSSPMTHVAHSAPGFDKVLHIAHAEWHGIRQATAYSPGQKLLIPSETMTKEKPQKILTETHKEVIAAEVDRMGITHVVAQGYSDNMDELLLYLRAKCGSTLWIGVVNHVTTAQFDNDFEMRMLSLLFLRQRLGTIDRIASVKPNFSQVFPEIWDKLIYNYAPNIPKGVFSKQAEATAVYTPLDVGWRKNMYTNILGGLLAGNVDQVSCANYPVGLENLADLRKLRMVGYLRGNALLAQMAQSRMVLLATFAECQPMTQLEAFAVGTPSMTRDLSLGTFADDELSGLCTTQALDDPSQLARDIERVIDASQDAAHMQEMIDDHLARRHALATERYAEFLGL